MRSAAIIILITTLLALSGQAIGAAGDWKVFLDASAIVDIHCSGDSLWCATNGGILLFDLTDSTYTQFFDGLGMRTSEVVSVTTDLNGSIWAAMLAEGIVRVDDPGGSRSVQLYTENSTFNEILDDSVNCMVMAGDEVYYGCANGVGKFFEGIHSLEPNLSDSLTGENVNSMTYDPAGDLLWVAFDRGMARFDRETFDYRSWPIGRCYSSCIFEGDVYCAAHDGVYRLEGDEWVAFGAGFHVLPVLDIASGEGGLYAVTEQRLYNYNGTFWASVATAEMNALFNEGYRIRTSHLRTVALDPAGNPWVGGRVQTGPPRGSYLSGYHGGSWDNRMMGNLTQNHVVSLATAPGEGVWASTLYGISYRSGGGEWNSYTRMRPDTGDDEALSYYASNLALLYDSRGMLWCNSLDYDLDMIDAGDPLSADDDLWSHFSVDDGTTITSDRFVRAKEDPAGNRWFLSDDEQQSSGKWGIDIVDATGTQWLSINPSTTPAMASGAVFDCDFTRTGVYLALRGYGVMYWHTGGFSWNTLSDTGDDYWVTRLGQEELPATQLKAIEYAPDGSLWIGTSSGLVREKSGVIDSFSVKTSFGEEGLVGLDVVDLELDAYGNLWVATNQGLNMVSPDGVIEAAYTTASLWEEKFQFVYPQSVISPLPSHVCNQLACAPQEDLLWIATDGGLALLDVSPAVQEELPLARAVLYPNPLHLGRGDNSLRISRISAPVDIKVYTLEGELVHEAFGVAEGEEAWDLLSLNGFKARSGVYLVRISTEAGSEIRKVAVIR